MRMSDDPNRPKLRPGTGRKLRAIAEARRWLLCDVVDIIADEYLRQNPDIKAPRKVPRKVPRRRKGVPR